MRRDGSDFLSLRFLLDRSRTTCDFQVEHHKLMTSVGVVFVHNFDPLCSLILQGVQFVDAATGADK